MSALNCSDQPRDIDLAITAHGACAVAQEVMGYLAAILLALKKETSEHTQARGLAEAGYYLAYDLKNVIDGEVENLNKAIEIHRAANENATAGGAP